jgi:hypothetical protein
MVDKAIVIENKIREMEKDGKEGAILWTILWE